MGYDVRIEGELTIPADKVEDAARALYAEARKKGKFDDHDKATCSPEGLKDAVNENLSEYIFYVWPVDDGSVTIEGHEDYVRREEQDEWILEALAPFIDDGELDLSGEDGAQWQYRIRGDEFETVYGTTVYGDDAKAPELLEQIIAVLYPEHLDGQPVTTVYDYADPEYETVVEKIEKLIREGGFGPQAGKSELERMAEVAE